jgi:hypothetical protein
VSVAHLIVGKIAVLVFLVAFLLDSVSIDFFVIVSAIIAVILVENVVVNVDVAVIVVVQIVQIVQIVQNLVLFY